jgi:glyoxylase-like metal-dependent hydrolase (beta-lactamase superfamily II)
MARVDHLTGGIYRISTYAPEKRISFNQFLIDDDEPALIHTGTFPMYADVRSSITQVLDPSRLRHVIVPHFEADECGGMGRFVSEAPNAVLACSALSARINLLHWDYCRPSKGHARRRRARSRKTPATRLGNPPRSSLGLADGRRRDDRKPLPFRLVHSAKRSTRHRSREFGSGHVRMVPSGRLIRWR